MLIREEMFLGVPLTDEVSQKLSEVDPSFRNFFIKDEGEYLQEKVYGGKVYVGKKISSIENLSELALIESNIYSLLKKMMPDHPCEEGTMWLFPILTDTQKNTYVRRK